MSLNDIVIFWISTRHVFHPGICLPSFLFLAFLLFYSQRFVTIVVFAWLCFQAFCCDFLVYNINVGHVVGP